MITREERFWAKVERTDSCWLWRGAKSSSGYGTFWDGTKQEGAHRYSYLTFRGLIPPEFELDHLCRERLCVNPAHLEPVTCAENLRRSPDTWATINASLTECRRGHPFTPDNLVKNHVGRRICKVCHRDRTASCRAKAKAS